MLGIVTLSLFHGIYKITTVLVSFESPTLAFSAS